MKIRTWDKFNEEVEFTDEEKEIEQRNLKSFWEKTTLKN